MDAMTNKWLSKQYCGLTAYIEEIGNKNSIFDSIAIKFGRFSNLDGLILDVGCGIRSDLAYDIHSKNSTFIGIDPFIKYKRNFEFIGGVGEYLPFKKNSFDHVIFATSLDHVINPNVVLKEAKRVLKEGGKLNIWCGCFDWFERLQEGEIGKAISLFFWNLDFRIRKKDNYHFSHFTIPKIISILRATGFTITKMERMLYDPSTAISVFFQAEKKETKRMSGNFDYQWKELPSSNIEFNIDRTKEFLKFTKLPRQFFKNKRCLDIGCGNGRYTYAMMMLGGDVTSFDISEEAIKTCKNVNKEAYVFDIAELKENRIYDFVFCWGVIHHTQNPRQSFSRIASQVRNGGMLHVMVYNKKYQYPYEEGRAKWNEWSNQEKMEYCRAKVSKVGGDIHGWWDALNPQYNFSYVPKETKKWFKEENFKKIRLTKRANINMQGDFKGKKES